MTGSRSSSLRSGTGRRDRRDRVRRLRPPGAQGRAAARVQLRRAEREPRRRDRASRRLRRIDEPFPGGESYRRRGRSHEGLSRRPLTGVRRREELLVAHAANRWALEHLLLGRRSKTSSWRRSSGNRGWTYRLDGGGAPRARLLVWPRRQRFQPASSFRSSLGCRGSDRSTRLPSKSGLPRSRSARSSARRRCSRSTLPSG